MREYLSLNTGKSIYMTWWYRNVLSIAQRLSLVHLMSFWSMLRLSVMEKNFTAKIRIVTSTFLESILIRHLFTRVDNMSVSEILKLCVLDRTKDVPNFRKKLKRMIKKWTTSKPLLKTLSNSSNSLKQLQDIKPERGGGNKTLWSLNKQDPKKDKEKTDSYQLIKETGKNSKIFKRLIEN